MTDIKDPLYRNVSHVDTSKVKIKTSYRLKKLFLNLLEIIFFIILLGFFVYGGYKFMNPEIYNLDGERVFYDEDIRNVRVGETILVETESENTGLFQKIVEEYVVETLPGGFGPKESETGTRLGRLEKDEYIIKNDKETKMIKENQILGKKDYDTKDDTIDNFVNKLIKRWIFNVFVLLSNILRNIEISTFL